VRQVQKQVKMLEQAEQRLAEAQAEIERLRVALRDLMCWGVTLDDSRLKYIEVQVDRAAIAAVEAALEI